MAKKRRTELTEEELGVIERFVHGFVTDKKRLRARKLLLGDSEQRIEGIQRLAGWLDPAVNVARIHSVDLSATNGELQGFLFDAEKVFRLTLTEAQAFANGGFGAVFISADGKIALLIPEVGEPVLCHRRTL